MSQKFYNILVHANLWYVYYVIEVVQVGWLFFFLFFFTAYQPFSGHLTPNQISNNSV